MSLARKGLLVSLGAYATMAVQVVQAMVLSRALGPDGVGRLTLFRLTLIFGAQIASLGLPMAMIHELNKSEHGASRIFGSVLRFTMIMTVLAVCILLTGMSTVARGFFGEISQPIVLGVAIFVPAVLLKAIYYSLIVVDLDARRMTAINFIPPLILATLYLILWMGYSISVERAVFAESIVLGIMAAALAFVLSRKSVRRINDENALEGGSSAGFTGIDFGLIKRLMPFGMQLVCTDFLVTINGYLMAILLRLFIWDFAQLGYYSRGMRLGTMVILAIEGVQRLLYSNWSKLEGDKLLQSVQRVVNACYMMVVPAAVIVLAAAKPLTLFLFGKDFLPAVPVTRITLFGLSAYMVVRLLQSYFNALRKSYYNLMVLGSGVLVTLVMGLVLIPSRQAVGAAWAITCGYLAMVVVGLYFGCAKCGLSFSAMFTPSTKVFGALYRSIRSKTE